MSRDHPKPSRKLANRLGRPYSNQDNFRFNTNTETNQIKSSQIDIN